MSTEAWERAVEAMRAKRRELIAQPLDRIYGDILRAAFPILAEDIAAMVGERADQHIANRKNYPDDEVSQSSCLECALEARAIALSIRARIEQMKEITE